MKITKKKFIVVTIASVIIVFFIYGIADYIHGTFYGWHGTSESYEQAQRLNMVRWYIPPEAKKINYDYGYYRGGSIIEASFEISEADFIRWAKQKGWQLEEIRNLDWDGHGILVRIPLSDSTDPPPITKTGDSFIFRRTVNITSGYFYRNDQLSEQFVYDKDRGIGYFRRFT